MMKNVHDEDGEVGDEFDEDELAPEHVEAGVQVVLPQRRGDHLGPVGLVIHLVIEL